MPSNHPNQPIILTNGVVRFKANALVRHLLDSYPGGLDALIRKTVGYHDPDYVQLMQLIGYSICGYCDLDSPTDAEKERARAEMAAIVKGKEVSEFIELVVGVSVV